MSEKVQRSGADRCMMTSPNGAGYYIMGGGNIKAKLAGGWKIMESDRNHLPSFQPENEKAETPIVAGVDPVKMETGKAGNRRERRSKVGGNR